MTQHPFHSRNDDEGLPRQSTPHTCSLHSPNEHKESSSTTHAHPHLFRSRNERGDLPQQSTPHTRSLPAQPPASSTIPPLKAPRHYTLFLFISYPTYPASPYSPHSTPIPAMAPYQLMPYAHNHTHICLPPRIPFKFKDYAPWVIPLESTSHLPNLETHHFIPP
jgi:hypothetical protein